MHQWEARNLVLGLFNGETIMCLCAGSLFKEFMWIYNEVSI